MSKTFHITIIATDSVDIEDVIDSPEREPLHAPIPEHPAENEDVTRRQIEKQVHRTVNYHTEEVKRRRQEDINKLTA